mmetsp:Transcript_39595/g.93307  ORF Transcript_39595/g.93307 Transcript_39595/m.93307 type:complete len:349 (-) Transcript_39595:60-1106(-)
MTLAEASGSPPAAKWLELFKARASPEDVAKAWVEALSPEAQEQAKADAPAARAQMRKDIVASDCPEVRADASQGYRYTGAVLRAADEALGIPPPVPSIQAKKGAGGAPSGKGAPVESRMVLPDDGRPGTLGLWWSDFETATRSQELAARGITHRLNVAAEAVHRFPEGGLPIIHVPMLDMFDTEMDEEMMEMWRSQFREILDKFKSLREQGAVVNVSCQMGKNRSGAVVMLWLCAGRGWQVTEAADFLRSVTHLALGNPHLAKAVTDVLGVEAVIPLNPAFDGGGWVCISPPGSPRAGGGDDAAPAAQEISNLAAQKLMGMSADEDGSDEDPDAPDVTDDLAGLFEDI